MISVEGGRAGEEWRAMYVCATPRTYLGYVRRRKPPTRRPSVRCHRRSWDWPLPCMYVGKGLAHSCKLCHWLHRELRSRQNELRQRMYKVGCRAQLDDRIRVDSNKVSRQTWPDCLREYATESIRGHQYSTSAMSRGQKKGPIWTVDTYKNLSIWGRGCQNTEKSRLLLCTTRERKGSILRQSRLWTAL